LPALVNRRIFAGLTRLFKTRRRQNIIIILPSLALSSSARRDAKRQIQRKSDENRFPIRKRRAPPLSTGVAPLKQAKYANFKRKNTTISVDIVGRSPSNLSQSKPTLTKILKKEENTY
jgi:hypothetical protein